MTVFKIASWFKTFTLKLFLSKKVCTLLLKISAKTGTEALFQSAKAVAFKDKKVVVAE